VNRSGASLRRGNLAQPIEALRVAAGTAWGDAGAFLSEHFATVTQSAVLERAIELLMATAETGTLADRKSATDQVARVLHGRGLL
jgi:hypothetical protein